MTSGALAPIFYFRLVFDAGFPLPPSFKDFFAGIEL